MLINKKKLGTPSDCPRHEEPSDNFLAFGYDAAMSVVKHALTKAVDIHEHAKPEDDPTLDDRKDITRADMRLVGRMNHYLTAKYAYAIVELAKADQELTMAEYVHDVLRKKEMLHLDDGKQKYKLDSRVALLPHVAKAYQEVLAKQALKSMLQALVEGLKAKQELYSREITRRQVEKERS